MNPLCTSGHSTSVTWCDQWRTGHIQSDSIVLTTFFCLLPSTCCTFQNEVGPFFPALKLYKLTSQLSIKMDSYNLLQTHMLRGFFPIPTVTRSDHKNVFFYQSDFAHSCNYHYDLTCWNSKFQLLYETPHCSSANWYVRKGTALAGQLKVIKKSL